MYLDEIYASVIEVSGRNVDKFGRVNWRLASDELNKKFPYRTESGWRKLYFRARKTAENKQKNGTSAKKINDAFMIVKKLLHRGSTIEDLVKQADISETEVFGIMKLLEERDFISVKKIGLGKTAIYIIDKTATEIEKREYVHAIGKQREFTFMVVSDTHMGSVYEQPSFINFCYDLAKERGIETVYHVGDISDGYYTNRPEQTYALHVLGFDQQAEYIERVYPRREGITTYFITGNHDDTHIRNGGADIGKRIAANRKDMIYLGVGFARVNLTPNCSMELFHPLDGSSYALSYSAQKYIDSLSGGDKPNILLVGHHHKAMYFFYRNIHAYECPSMCMQSAWEKRKRINNTSGAWILTVLVDEEGTVVSMKNELIPQYSKVKDDYLNFKRSK